MFRLRNQARPLSAVFTAVVCALGLVAVWRPAWGEWVETRNVGNFRLQAEFPLSDENGQFVINEISQLHDDVHRLLQLPEGDGVVELTMFSTRARYVEYISLRVPEGVNRPALFVQGPDMGRVYVYLHWGYETDVRHECTHAVLHTVLPYVPLWLDEGLAEYFEVPAGNRGQGSPHLGELKRRILFGWRPNLAALESLSNLTEMDAEHYRESWAWAHYLLHGPLEVRQVLSDFLYDIQQGNLAGPFSERLYDRFPEIDSQLVTHLRNW